MCGGAPFARSQSIAGVDLVENPKGKQFQHHPIYYGQQDYDTYRNLDVTCKVEGGFGTKVYAPLAEDGNCKPWTKFDLIHRQCLHYRARDRRVLCGISDGELDILGCKVTSVRIEISMERKKS